MADREGLEVTKFIINYEISTNIFKHPTDKKVEAREILHAKSKTLKKVPELIYQNTTGLFTETSPRDLG